MGKVAKASIADVASASFRKGEAKPSASVAGAGERLTPVTVRLNDADYRRLKQFGVDHRLKSQTIIVAAIRRHLDAETAP